MSKDPFLKAFDELLKDQIINFIPFEKSTGPGRYLSL
jgi:hypothetical protein